VHIRAPREAVWQAITDPDWTERYGYHVRSEFELQPGGAFRSYANEGMKAYGSPDIVVEGEVLEADPPNRLVQTWRMLFDENLSGEQMTRITYELDDDPEVAGVTRLTLIHDLEGAPVHASLITGDQPMAGGGWPMVLSDLKTLLETGKSLRS
jgi:uncharacterized protein YndB with AHSA1/START domain